MKKKIKVQMTATDPPDGIGAAVDTALADPALNEQIPDSTIPTGRDFAESHDADFSAFFADDEREQDKKRNDFIPE